MYGCTQNVIQKHISRVTVVSADVVYSFLQLDMAC